MNKQPRQKGFSLTEVLMATGILAMGLMLVAMAFPVGIKLVSVSTERTIGDAAIGEAVATMHLYADWLPAASYNLAQMIPTTGSCVDFTGTLSAWSVNVRFYPSLVPLLEKDKRYCWSILARRTDPNTNEVQTTVLVCRIQDGGTYYTVDEVKTSSRYGKVNGTKKDGAPVPVKVEVEKITSTAYPNRVLKIVSDWTGEPEYNFFTEGCTILVDNVKDKEKDKMGHLCRVLELRDVDSDGKRDLILQDDYPDPELGQTAYIWVVPPAVGNSRNPCIRVWQSDLTF